MREGWGVRERSKFAGVGGRIILNWIFRKYDRGVGWIRLAKDRDKWKGAFERGDEPGFSKVQGIS